MLVINKLNSRLIRKKKDSSFSAEIRMSGICAQQTELTYCFTRARGST